MDELRVLRREEGSLILANELGEEYRLAIDEEVAQEVRLATRRAAATARVRPREIQALLRAGKTRSEVAAETGLDEADVERFEEPVRAEQRYMLDLAHAVTVRTDPAASADTPSANDGEQRFGQVISERLIGLGNTINLWRSWRDEDAGWLIGLEFDSRDGDHDAVWSFDHKKRVLSPLTPDATNLSKIGDLGDRLIPKLRAVDNEQNERREPETFDPDALLAPTAEVQPITPDTDQAAAASEDAPLSPDAEYERRREIDTLAINTPDDRDGDLSQTADLLDALRRRRGERSLEAELPIEDLPRADRAEELADGGNDANDQGATDAGADEAPTNGSPAGGEPQAGAESGISGLVDPGPSTRPVRRSGAAANIWGTSGVSGTPDTPAVPRKAPGSTPNAPRSDERSGGQGQQNEPSRLRAVLGDISGPPGVRASRSDSSPATPAQTSSSRASEPASDSADAQAKPSGKRSEAKRDSKRGRSSIPSWDDILFGTRSDDDPA
ncbi:septation protein SepH [Leucobacter komagatae]|uniref:DUF3071 domain-containing protein n=1 Tax=Leucobacter komagatae TaxID=55969 RepID=A0A0D0IPH3_9MICO|nr:septation protein SepH [Leucobacter komagatae]KIP52957.1 hypothetical protein SD72_05465 [Leucobacter komagatae]